MVLDDILMIDEGETAYICVNVTNSQQQREVDIILTFSVTEGNEFTSMSSNLHVILMLTDAFL